MASASDDPDWFPGTLTSLVFPPKTFPIPSNLPLVLGCKRGECDGYIWWDKQGYVDEVHCSVRAVPAEPGAGFQVTITDHSEKGTYVDDIRLDRDVATDLVDGAIVTLGGLRGWAIEFKVSLSTAPIHAYALQDLIGEGSCGKVWRAMRRSTGLVVAVKHIDTSTLSTKALSACRRELDIIRALPRPLHPNIVNTIETFDDKTSLHIVMEYARYGDLRGQVEDGWGMTLERAHAAMRGICAGLSYLHAMDIIHRDVKPENILVCAQKPLFVKLTDFGWAKDLTECDGAQTFCGTLDYMAPEVVTAGLLKDNGSLYDFKVDSWSLGVTFFYMLTGHLPFGSESSQSLFSIQPKHLIQWKFFPPQAGAQAREIVTKLLQENAEHRWTVADALNHQWLASTYVIAERGKTKITLQPTDDSVCFDFDDIDAELA